MRSAFFRTRKRLRDILYLYSPGPLGARPALPAPRWTLRFERFGASFAPRPTSQRRQGPPSAGPRTADAPGELQCAMAMSKGGSAPRGMLPGRQWSEGRPSARVGLAVPCHRPRGRIDGHQQKAPGHHRRIDRSIESTRPAKSAAQQRPATSDRPGAAAKLVG